MEIEVLRRVRFTSQLWDTADYLAQNSLEVAERFLDAVEVSINFLQSFPESGELIESRTKNPGNIRLWQVRDFPNFLLIFRVQDQRIDLLSLIHGARLTDAIIREIATDFAP